MQLHLQKRQRMNLDETLPVKVLTKNLASPSDEAVLQIHSITILLQARKSAKMDWTVYMNEEYE